jgi:hypothetical protein
MSSPYFTKDPDAVLDYAFDWSAWLAEGEVIATSAITVPVGLTLDSEPATTSTVTAWLSGGEVGQHKVTCHIETNQGRADDRSITVNVRAR